MRTFRLKGLWKVAAFLTVLVIFSSSCKEDDPIVSDYVGTWVTQESIPFESGFVEVKETMTLTDNSFDDLLQMQTGTNAWTDFARMKGSMAVSGNVMNLMVTEIGMTSFNMFTGMPTGTLMSYKEGSSEFNGMMDELEQPKSFKSEYSISGNKLTVKTDSNEDGDFDDELEVTVYTRQ